MIKFLIIKNRSSRFVHAKVKSYKYTFHFNLVFIFCIYWLFLIVFVLILINILKYNVINLFNMKNYKQILEAINKGIQLALDDEDDS